jgi:O-antigen/teichoic acid export membrane protein
MTLRRSVVASVAGTYGVFVIQIAASMVLARLLTPAEMGVWGIAQAAILLSSTIRDFGAGDYLVRRGKIDAQSIGRVFALMLCISLGCALILWFGRSAIAAFFGEPRLVGLIGIATLTYLLIPFGLGALVTLECELAFATLQVMQLVATTIGSVTAIVLAFRGFSFYSLAWGQFAQMVTLLILRTAARPHAVFCRPVFSEWKDMLHFGTFTTLTSVVGQISTQSVTAIIGRVLGFSPLGLFDRAQGMSNYVSSGLMFPVMQVVYVGFSRARNDSAKLTSLFLTTIENLSGFLWPAYALMAVVSTPMFSILYGPQWVAAAPLFRLICIGGFFLSLYNAPIRLLVSQGRVRTIFLVESLVMCLRIGAVITLARSGIYFATMGVVAPTIVAAALYWWAASRHVDLWNREVAVIFARSLIVTLSTIAIPILIAASRIVAGAPEILQFLLSATTGGAGWLAAIWLSGHRLRGEVGAVFRHGSQLFIRTSGVGIFGKHDPSAPNDIFP